jgi:hypothetical protein
VQRALNLLRYAGLCYKISTSRRNYVSFNPRKTSGKPL